MNLMLADVNNAREVLALWGIPPDRITTGWHEGEMSLIIEYEVGDYLLEDSIPSMLESTTSITLPIVIKIPEEEFSFNFDTAP